MKQGMSLVLPPEGFVRLPVVIRVMGIGKTTWWNGIKAGRFPKPVKLGARTSAWRVEDIRALIANPMKEE
jgi:predicted DNA-binding transcriptional regulator AlpA